MWWVPFKEREIDHLCTPVDPVKPIQSDTQPPDTWGPYDCLECALWAGWIGLGTERARARVHGTEDEAFFSTLGAE